MPRSRAAAVVCGATAAARAGAGAGAPAVDGAWLHVAPPSSHRCCRRHGRLWSCGGGAWHGLVSLPFLGRRRPPGPARPPPRLPLRPPAAAATPSHHGRCGRCAGRTAWMVARRAPRSFCRCRRRRRRPSLLTGLQRRADSSGGGRWRRHARGPPHGRHQPPFSQPSASAWLLPIRLHATHLWSASISLCASRSPPLSTPLPLRFAPRGWPTSQLAGWGAGGGRKGAWAANGTLRAARRRSPARVLATNREGAVLAGNKKKNTRRRRERPTNCPSRESPQSPLQRRIVMASDHLIAHHCCRGERQQPLKVPVCLHTPLRPVAPVRYDKGMPRSARPSAPRTTVKAIPASGAYASRRGLGW